MIIFEILLTVLGICMTLEYILTKLLGMDVDEARGVIILGMIILYFILKSYL